MRIPRKTPCALLSATWCVLLSTSATANPGYSSGNIVVSHYSETLEANAVLFYTPGGSLVREVEIPPPPGEESFTPRDLVVDDQGRVHVMLVSGGNLTLSTLTGAGWTNRSFPNWTQNGVTYYGGIGINEDYIFCPDQDAGSDPTIGIVRFPLDDLDAPEHFTTPEFHAVKVGLNGFVYGINRVGDCSWYHPDTMAKIGELPRFKLFRAASVINFAVDGEGKFYTVDLDDIANRFDSAGNFIETISGGGALGDVEVSPNGDILVSGANRNVMITDDEFVPFCEFPIPESPDPSGAARAFLYFANPPTVPSPSPGVPEIVDYSVESDRFVVRIQSEIGRQYVLERSTTLAGWQRLGSPVAGTGDILALEDATPGLPDDVFYRVGCQFPDS